MCGIAGLVDASGESSAEHLIADARAMALTLTHRGPDGEGCWADPTAGLALGFRRLAIMDPSPAGAQPMHSPSGRFVAVFNGEVYDHERLRAEVGKGVAYRGHGDTEVLLAAIDRWGVRGALERVNGMFALAVWDRRDGTLTLARDRIGEKPLYYGWAGRHFVFGSELKALRAHPGFDTTVDRGSLARFLRLSYVPHPRTIFRSARTLPPGSFVEVKPEALVPGVMPAPVRWWELARVAEDGVHDRSSPLAADAVDDLDQLLRDAVAIRRSADVGVGAFLSGGVDSSTIVAMLVAGGGPVRTFTMSMPEISYDESASARAVAEHFSTDHVEVPMSVGEALAVVPRLPRLYDEPFADPSALPTHLVAEAAGLHVTVALSGDGGDEIFGGYNRQVAGTRLWRRVSRVPRPVRSLAARALRAPSPTAWDRLGRQGGRLLPARRRPPNVGDKVHKAAGVLAADGFDDFYLGLVSAWNPADLLGFDEWPTLATPRAVAGPAERMLFLDTARTLPDQMLVKVDRASMGVSLEVRVPLLDHRVVELGWRLPYAAKARRAGGKWILREVLRRYLPDQLVDRPKMGFDPPLDAWLRGPLREWAEDLLAPRGIAAGGLDPQPVAIRWREHQAGRRNCGYALWTILMYLAWRDAS